MKIQILQVNYSSKHLALFFQSIFAVPQVTPWGTKCLPGEVQEPTDAFQVPACALQKGKVRMAPARRCRTPPVVEGTAKLKAPQCPKAQPNDKPQLSPNPNGK